jgi:glycosyltransferase 2 family protein
VVAASDTGVESPVVPLQARRGRLRILLALLGVGFGVHLLLPQVDELHSTLDAVRHAAWPWLVLAACAYVGSLVGSGIALVGASQGMAPLLDSCVVQLPAAALGHLSPGGLAALEMQARFLQHAGMLRRRAAGAVASTEVAGFLVGLIGLGLAAALAGWGELDDVHVPRGFPVLVVVVVASVAIGVVAGRGALRKRALGMAGQVVSSVRLAFQRPRDAAMLFGGTAMSTASLVVALDLALRAFHAQASFPHVTAAYLVAFVVATVSPTPGGIGVMEAALVAGLTRLGVEAAPAVAGVLGFRLISFWLPIPPALVVASRLRRRDVI